MAGVNGCIKYSMFIFNFLFWVCGTVILGLAIWLRVSKNGKEIITSGDSSSDPLMAVNILIAVGAIIMVLGFLGCCGAVKESRCMLLLFFIGLFLILILQLAAGILGATVKSGINRVLNETLHENVKLLDQTSDTAKEFQEAMNSFQKEFECCGLVEGISDWGSNYQQAMGSCECSSDTPKSSCMTFQEKDIYRKTCMESIQDFFQKHIIIVIGIAFGLAIIEVLGLVFSMVLYCQIGSK